jgi:2-dehydro-3-deoxygluconokinase
MSVTTVQCVGECMLEIARGPQDAVSLGYAGDTYNTAVYLARVADRLGAPVGVRFLTGVGQDTESGLMRARWRAEGVGDDALVVAGAAPGAYLITTDELGERSFAYWRAGSAAARLFADTGWLERVGGDYVYLSGVTVQLLSERSLAGLVQRLGRLRRAGARVVFDSNYRPAGWPTAAMAQHEMAAVLRVCDVALVTLEDEVAMGACRDVPTCLGRLAALGVSEAVVKVGRDGAWVMAQTTGAPVRTQVPTRPVAATDTTGAGDSFNGAYLAGRIAGLDPVQAARLGNTVAGHVVAQAGAIVDPTHMPTLMPTLTS